jgi:hypothetical protein
VAGEQTDMTSADSNNTAKNIGFSVFMNTVTTRRKTRVRRQQKSKQYLVLPVGTSSKFVVCKLSRAPKQLIETPKQSTTRLSEPLAGEGYGHIQQ